MVAAQFSLLKWNHLSRKKREILTSGMPTAGQKTLFDMLAKLLNTFTLGYRWVRDTNNVFQKFSPQELLELILVLIFFTSYNVLHIVLLMFLSQKHFATKLKNRVSSRLSYIFLVLREEFLQDLC